MRFTQSQEKNLKRNINLKSQEGELNSKLEEDKLEELT